jgi:isoleucyl-tRNA synthetase
LNIKEISYVAEDGELMSLTAEPVFKKLGPKFGKVVNQAADAVRSFSEKEITNILRDGGERLVIDGHEAMIVQDDIIIKSVNKPGIAAAVDGDLTAALSTTVSEELLFEGLAREFVNRVQNMRKDAGLDVTDRIIIHYQASEQMAAAIEKQTSFIKNETLAATIVTGLTAAGFQKEWSIDDHSVVVVILKTE